MRPQLAERSERKLSGRIYPERSRAKRGRDEGSHIGNKETDCFVTVFLAKTDGTRGQRNTIDL